MTIEVPANLVPEIERTLADLAKALDEQPTASTRRVLEITLLSRGLEAMRKPDGSIALSVKAKARKKAKSA